jgi:hypothetical protein
VPSARRRRRKRALGESWPKDSTTLRISWLTSGVDPLLANGFGLTP